MSEHSQYKANKRPRTKLQRSADGRLRPTSSGGADIGDIWAEQRRIRLAEAIQEDKRKAEKKKQGWRRFLKRWHRPGNQAVQASSSAPKEIVVKVSIPKVTLPAIPVKKTIEASVQRFKPVSGLKKARRMIPVVAVVFLGVAGYFAYDHYAHGEKKSGKPTLSSSEVLQAKKETPAYPTVLPQGKTIDDLGGWHRVSPPNKEPVFAYADTVSGKEITVSQQPLPESFKKDIAGGITTLAQQFNATQKLIVDDMVAYVGTSEKGPQSVITSKNNLLILIKASGKLGDPEWAAYLGSLR